MEQSCQNKSPKIAIVGGGPSGIYCAIHILENFKKNNFNNFSLFIFDKGQILRTILPTGGTRCNITNSISDIYDFASNYPRGEKFLYSIFSKHSNFDSLDFFKSIGIDTYTSSDNRIYPISNSSSDVKNKLLNKLNSYKNFKLIHKKINSSAELKDFDYIIISSGSRKTENLILSFNHKLVPFKKSLVGLKVENMSYPEGVCIKSLDGDFIFTKNGISGPLAFILSAKNINALYPYEINIKLFNENSLKELISRNPKKSIGNLVSAFVPKSFAHVIIENFHKKSAEVSRKEIENYSNLKLKITGTETMGEIVNSGGVALNELTNNCKSKIYDNLWFCGEILDIDGLCGGFNLQNCWSTAYVVAKDVINTIINKKDKEN